MKIMAWHDTYPARTKDAQDLLFLMKEYLNAGNQDRLYDTAADILSATGFSLEVAGPRLLGRDIRRMVHAETREKLLAILTTETAGIDSQFRLLSDMTRTTLRDDARLEEVLLLLRQVKAGLPPTDRLWRQRRRHIHLSRRLDFLPFPLHILPTHLLRPRSTGPAVVLLTRSCARRRCR